ncbi:hypothetical protein AGMMS49982_05200 [Bacteroidia bacterium]|nr:hypothetical protein AGMMS49982_05200 [Bacteroidia bacterium]
MEPAPEWVLKTNLVDDLTSTLNIGAEFYTSPYFSLGASLNYNPWRFSDYGFKLKHLLLQPEFRFWFDEPFRGHNIGIHGIVTQFDLGALPTASIPPQIMFGDISPYKMHEEYYQGWGFGGGLSYGYMWSLAPRWKFEFSLGIGYMRFKFQRAQCIPCGSLSPDVETKQYIGPTKLALSLVYTFGSVKTEEQIKDEIIHKTDLYVEVLDNPIIPEEWTEPEVNGMSLVKQGFITLGTPEDDEIWGAPESTRGVSLEPFWMDITEITNAEYRQFVYWVRDSILRERLYDPAFGGNNAFKIETYKGEPLETPILNWKKRIPSKRKANETELRALKSIDYVNPVTKEVRTPDPNQMVYHYTVYDAKQAALRRNRFDPERRIYNTDITERETIMISKDTAYINEDGKIVRETITRELSSEWDFANTYIVNIHPDESAWINDFYNANNDPYMRFYFTSPLYDNYPVIGVSWEQANAFCHWRTEQLKKSLPADMRDKIEPFRLPTEAEFEYASRVRTANIYPWEQYSAMADDGSFLGNFKPGDGDYIEDGYLITAPVASFTPNEFGIYDLAGNVAEWTSTTFLEAGLQVMDDINPQYEYNAAKEDPYVLKKKTIRGGSWKDEARSLRGDIRAYEYQNEQRSYIGFRCVRTQMGFSKR